MTLSINVMIKKLAHAADLPIPCYMTAGSSGMDLFAAVDKEVVLNPGAYQLISTGISLAIPPGYEGQVRPRSGLAVRHGLTLLNSPGTVDSDYRGEVKVILINLGTEKYQVQRGERIAQLVINQVPKVVLHEVDELPDSARGEEGFGHTGKFNA